MGGDGLVFSETSTGGSQAAGPAHALQQPSSSPGRGHLAATQCLIMVCMMNAICDTNMPAFLALIERLG